MLEAIRKIPDTPHTHPLIYDRSLTIVGLKWNQRFRDKKTNLNICHHMVKLFVHTTAKQVISGRGKNENLCEMSKKCTYKACKTNVFICCRRRRGCLSSLVEGRAGVKEATLHNVTFN